MRGIFAAGIVAALSGTAFAADVLPPSPRQAPAAPGAVPIGSPWDGLYIGGNAGWAASSVSFTTTDAFGQGTGSQSASGFAGGGQIGAGKTFGRLYLGTEIDWQASSLTATNGTTQFSNGTTSPPGITTSVDSFGTARARVGYTFGALNEWLAYGTGGAAFGHATATNSAPGISFAFPGAWSVGWAAGAGLEWMFAPGWSVGAEYLHTDFGGPSVNLNSPGNVFGITSDVSATGNVARGKINLHF
jgi:outer membrane immunogenic protein